MTPATKKKAAKLGIEDRIYVEVTLLGSDDIEINAAYNRGELVVVGEKRLVGVYELVGLEQIMCEETVTVKEIT